VSGFVQGEVPGVTVDQVAACTGRVRLHAAGAEEYPDSFGAQGFDTADRARVPLRA
jgi:hypothetical protein